jgi:CBS domain-containing protein
MIPNPLALGCAGAPEGGSMKVGELMTQDVEVIRPDDSLQTAAKMMADLDAGILPVGENDRLVGMITDRDITVRAVAKGRAPEKTTVRDAMSEEVRYCFEDEDSEEVARKMGSWQMRRLPVLNRDKRLVGIVSLGDLVIGGSEEPATEALKEISQP